LLVVKAPHRTEHLVLLSGLEETLLIGDRSYPLSTHLYEERIFPDGYVRIENFYRKPFPSWIFRVENLAFLKIVMIIEGQKTVLIRYQLLSSYGDFVRLIVRPITAFRPSTQITRMPDRLMPQLEVAAQTIELKSQNRYPSMRFFHNSAVVDREGKWFRDQVYGKHFAKNGVVRKEDLYSPCSFHYAFNEEDGVYLCVTTEKKRIIDPFLLELQEKRRRHVQLS